MLGFVVVVTGISAGVPLVLVWVGLPVLVATLLAARGLATLERYRLAVLQGRGTPSTSYAVVSSSLQVAAAELNEPPAQL